MSRGAKEGAQFDATVPEKSGNRKTSHRPKKTLEELAMADLEQVEEEGVVREKDSRVEKEKEVKPKEHVHQKGKVAQENNSPAEVLLDDDVLVQEPQAVPSPRSSQGSSPLVMTKAPTRPKTYTEPRTYTEPSTRPGRDKEEQEDLSTSIQQSLALLSPGDSSSNTTHDRVRLPSDSPLYPSPALALVRQAPALRPNPVAGLAGKINMSNSANYSSINRTSAGASSTTLPRAEMPLDLPLDLAGCDYPELDMAHARMEALEPAPARGTGRKRGRPKGSGRGAGRKPASPSPKQLCEFPVRKGKRERKSPDRLEIPTWAKINKNSQYNHTYIRVKYRVNPTVMFRGGYKTPK